MFTNEWFDYLNKHFIDKNTLALECETTVEFINLAIENRALPQPSYTLKGSFTLESHINAVSSEKSLVASYFPLSIKKWVLLAIKNSKSSNIVTAAAELEKYFKENYSAELEKRGLVRGSQESNDSLENTWKHFLLGTYGVCVKDIANISNIASKQFAARKLSELTDDGEKQEFASQDKEKIKAAIREYNEYTTDFGPWEYHKTSRKRLVDNISSRL